MTSKDIEKLEQADQLMFNLPNSNNPKRDILKVGQLLKEVKILDDASNLQTIVDTYNQNAQDEIKNAIRKKMRATVGFHPEILIQYLHDEDDMIDDIAKDCLTNFTKYGQIVIRFDDKKAAWKAEKSGEEYRQTFHELDEKCHRIHNDCIDSIAVINRLSSRDGSATTYATWDNSSITDIKKVPRSDIGNTIIEQYLNDLVQNDQKILKEITK